MPAPLLAAYVAAAHRLRDPCEEFAGIACGPRGRRLARRWAVPAAGVTRAVPLQVGRGDGAALHELAGTGESGLVDAARTSALVASRRDGRRGHQS